MGGWSEEEYLLEHDNHISNMYSNYHGDLLGSFNDKDVHHTHIKIMGTQKYLRKSCYHRIECTIATFFAAFIWKRPLNSDALATTTHRKLNRVSDGTNTQVVTQMINKCRIKIVQKELYNVRNPSWMKDREREREKGL